MPEFLGGTIVCNTGPLIGLSRAGLCHLIGSPFARVLLPAASVCCSWARSACWAGGGGAERGR